jgi:hypothetical protein
MRKVGGRCVIIYSLFSNCQKQKIGVKLLKEKLTMHHAVRASRRGRGGSKPFLDVRWLDMFMLHDFLFQ